MSSQNTPNNSHPYGHSAYFNQQGNSSTSSAQSNPNSLPTITPLHTQAYQAPQQHFQAPSPYLMAPNQALYPAQQLAVPSPYLMPPPPALVLPPLPYLQNIVPCPQALIPQVTAQANANAAANNSALVSIDFCSEFPPPTLGQLDPPTRRPKGDPQPLLDAAGSVRTHSSNGLVLRSFPGLPDSFPQLPAMWQVETWFRLWPKFSYQDVNARMPHGTPKWQRTYKNSLNNRRMREARREFNCRDWSGRHSQVSSKTLVEFVSRLSTAQLHRNTSWVITSAGIHPPNCPTALLPQDYFIQASGGVAHTASSEVTEALTLLHQLNATAHARGEADWTKLKQTDLPRQWFGRVKKEEAGSDEENKPAPKRKREEGANAGGANAGNGGNTLAGSNPGVFILQGNYTQVPAPFNTLPTGPDVAEPSAKRTKETQAPTAIGEKRRRVKDGSDDSGDADYRPTKRAKETPAAPARRQTARPAAARPAPTVSRESVVPAVPQPVVAPQPALPPLGLHPGRNYYVKAGREMTDEEENTLGDLQSRQFSEHRQRHPEGPPLQENVLHPRLQTGGPGTMDAGSAAEAPMMVEDDEEDAFGEIDHERPAEGSSSGQNNIVDETPSGANLQAGNSLNTFFGECDLAYEGPRVGDLFSGGVQEDATTGSYEPVQTATGNGEQSIGTGGQTATEEREEQLPAFSQEQIDAIVQYTHGFATQRQVQEDSNSVPTNAENGWDEEDSAALEAAFTEDSADVPSHDGGEVEQDDAAQQAETAQPEAATQQPEPEDEKVSDDTRTEDFGDDCRSLFEGDDETLVLPSSPVHTLSPSPTTVEASSTPAAGTSDVPSQSQDVTQAPALPSDIDWSQVIPDEEFNKWLASQPFDENLGLTAPGGDSFWNGQQAHQGPSQGLDDLVGSSQEDQDGNAWHEDPEIDWSQFHDGSV